MVRVCLQTETAKLGLSNVLVLEISPAEKKRAFSIKFKNYFKPQVFFFFLGCISSWLAAICFTSFMMLQPNVLSFLQSQKKNASSLLTLIVHVFFFFCYRERNVNFVNFDSLNGIAYFFARPKSHFSLLIISILDTHM